MLGSPARSPYIKFELDLWHKNYLYTRLHISRDNSDDFILSGKRLKAKLATTITEDMASEHSVMAVIRAARPNFRNSQDKVAFAVNATFLVSGYVLNATGPPAFADDSLSSSSTGIFFLYVFFCFKICSSKFMDLFGGCCIEEVGIDRWNELDGEYAFLYVIPGKTSEKTLVKCLAMNDKLLVAVLATGTKEPLHLEIE